MQAREKRTIRSVLVVDDDERILEAWARSKVARDRTIATARDSAAAREIAATGNFDLAVVDLRLANTSGIELIRELKRDNANLAAVLCSGYLSVTTAVAAVRAGADLIVFKPITFREVLRRVEEGEDDDDVPDLEETPTLARAEWEHIMRVLGDCNGNVSMAARRLGIYRSSLQRRLRKYAPRE